MSRRLLVIVAVLVGGFAVRVWNLNTESIWHDEGWSIRAIRGPFTTPDDNTPYGYYTLGHALWRLGTGETALAFRYTSVLLGVLTVAVAIRVAWRWYGGGISLATGSLVAVSPLLWEYAQEVRAYVVVPLIALVLLAQVGALAAFRAGAGEVRPQVWVRSRRLNPESKIWLSIWITEFLGLYTHNLVVPLVVWASIAVGIIWLIRHDWQRIIIWGIAHLILILTYIPWLLTQSPSGTPLNTPPRWGLGLVQDIWYSYFLPVLPQWQATPNDLWLNIVGGIAIIAILILLIRVPTSRTWVLVSQLILVPFLSTILLQTAHIDFHPRYYIAAVPATLFALVAGLAQLPLKRRLVNVALTVLVLGGIGLSQSSLHRISTTRAYQHDDFAALAAYYATLPAETVILIPFEREPAIQDYYARQFNIGAQFLNITLHNNEAETLNQLATLATPRPIEFLTWFQLPADIRGMYPCLLAASSDYVRDKQTFYGLETQAYYLRQSPQFQALAASPHYADVELAQIGWMTSDQAICVRTEWVTSTSPATHIHVVMRLLNNLGWLLDQSDAVIRDTQQDAHWRRGASYHLLKLPNAAPTTTYSLEWSIYSEQAPQGYDTLSADGASLGVNYRLEGAVQAAGPPLSTWPTHSQIVSDNVATALDSGTHLEVTLLLVSPVETVTLVGDTWQQQQVVISQNVPSLSWHQFIIPPDADGQATLYLDDGTIVAMYTIHKIDRSFEMPTLDISVEGEFIGVGRLVGATIPTLRISPTQPFALTLGWQATATPDKAYTVFAQILDKDGRAIAQSDSQPAQGQRPTTGWLPDEYILDNHLLGFRVNDYRGVAYLIVGFYDPLSFERILTTDGRSYMQLPIELTIE